MANTGTITQVQVSGVTTAYTIYDSTKARATHNHDTTYALTSHVHYYGTGLKQGYANWGTIGSVNTTNNNTTTAIQLASWGLAGYYTGFFKNKNAYTVSANGWTSSLAIYSITVTPAQPWVSEVVHGSTHARFTVNGANVYFAGDNATGASRTVAAGGTSITFYGNAILSPSNMKSYKASWIKI